MGGGGEMNNDVQYSRVEYLAGLQGYRTQAQAMLQTQESSSLENNHITVTFCNRLKGQHQQSDKTTLEWHQSVQGHHSYFSFDSTLSLLTSRQPALQSGRAGIIRSAVFWIHAIKL